MKDISVQNVPKMCNYQIMGNKFFLHKLCAEYRFEIWEKNQPTTVWPGGQRVNTLMFLWPTTGNSASVQSNGNVEKNKKKHIVSLWNQQFGLTKAIILLMWLRLRQSWRFCHLRHPHGMCRWVSHVQWYGTIWPYCCIHV